MSSQTGRFDIVIFCHHNWGNIVRWAALVDDQCYLMLVLVWDQLSVSLAEYTLNVTNLGDRNHTVEMTMSRERVCFISQPDYDGMNAFESDFMNDCAKIDLT